ncbi:hypothetical protein M123_1255 [Bacteroides fragilis str. 3976T8]|uniref:Uncharacterized protein n=1 Tax=Bacteroides fragilis str. 3976T8 TaxID=1339314 RepID=A0A016EBJ4_BACFG|nr:hypothetical protein M123_1255 [Bacteroides fragilis str. 3976T8]
MSDTWFRVKEGNFLSFSLYIADNFISLQTEIAHSSEHIK